MKLLDIELVNNLRSVVPLKFRGSYLNLRRSKIGNAEVINLTEMLVRIYITNLDLSYNYIEAEGAKAIIEAAKNNISINYLNLGSNYIRDGGVINLANSLIYTSITHLDISCNQIGDIGAKSIATAVKNSKIIIHLNLSYNDIERNGTIELAEAFKINRSIISFDISYNQIGEAGAVLLANSFANNNIIKYFNLSFNNIGDNGAITLANVSFSKFATYIDLSGSKIGNFGIMRLADALKNNKHITYLNLVNNDIGYIGTIALANILNHTHITHLDLSCNKIGDSGMIKLANILRSNKFIISLKLRNNQIGDLGLIKLNYISSRIKFVIQLDLSYNLIESRGAKEIINSIKDNRFIIFFNLNGNPINNGDYEDIIRKLAEKNKNYMDKLCDNIISLSKKIPIIGFLSVRDYELLENIEKISLMIYLNQICGEKNITLFEEEKMIVNNLISEKTFRNNIFKITGVCKEVGFECNLGKLPNEIFDNIVSNVKPGDMLTPNNKSFFRAKKQDPKKMLLRP